MDSAHMLNETSNALFSQEIRSLKKTSNDISEIEKNVEDLMHRIVLPSITSIHLSMSDNQNDAAAGERERVASEQAIYNLFYFFKCILDDRGNVRRMRVCVFSGYHRLAVMMC